MDVRGFGFAPQSSLKQLLSRHIIAAVQFNYTAIIKRVCIARQSQFRPQTRFGDGKISARPRGNFRYRRVFLD
jgi:hypothetical protein